MTEENKQAAPWDVQSSSNGKQLLRRSLPWLGVLVLVAAVVWGLWKKPAQVETEKVGKRPLTVFVSEEGKTRIRNRYVVTASVAGTMERVVLKAGDAVVAGETVMTQIQPVATPLLDPRSRAQAEAALAGAEARREQASMALEAAKQASAYAVAERDRMNSLNDSGSLSKSARERIETESSIKQVERRSTEFALKVAESDVERAKVLLERPNEGGKNNRVVVTSPVSGVVLHVLQESETSVNPGTPIVEVGNPNDLEVEAEILSRDAVGIKVGDDVSIEQWGGHEPLHGRVRRVEPAAFTKFSALGVEEQRVLVLIDLLDLPATAKMLGDRFRVEVRVAVWHSDEALVAPSGALFREGNDWKVYRYEGGNAVSVKVNAGQSDGQFTQVLSGLNDGDEVLVHPPDTITDGVSVKRRK
jgi:HlyD family secretion protein